jgi:hypothetical protein
MTGHYGLAFHDMEVRGWGFWRHGKIRSGGAKHLECGVPRPGFGPTSTGTAIDRAKNAALL